jgi:hypothetical protein
MRTDANEGDGSRSRSSKTIPAKCQVFRASVISLPQIASIEITILCQPKPDLTNKRPNNRYDPRITGRGVFRQSGRRQHDTETPGQSPDLRETVSIDRNVSAGRSRQLCQVHYPCCFKSASALSTSPSVRIRSESLARVPLACAAFATAASIAAR